VCCDASSLFQRVGVRVRLTWLFAPLHPSIIHEDNIRLALSARHDEPKDLANPLLLHVHAALAFGTLYLPLAVLRPHRWRFFTLTLPVRIVQAHSCSRRETWPTSSSSEREGS